jgi:hypothetical protein
MLYKLCSFPSPLVYFGRPSVESCDELTSTDVTNPNFKFSPRNFSVLQMTIPERHFSEEETPIKLLAVARLIASLPNWQQFASMGVAIYPCCYPWLEETDISLI